MVVWGWGGSGAPRAAQHEGDPIALVRRELLQQRARHRLEQPPRRRRVGRGGATAERRSRERRARHLLEAEPVPAFGRGTQLTQHWLVLR